MIFQAQQISPLNLGLGFLLLIITLIVSFIFELKLIPNILLSFARMTIQLVLIGLFLQFLVNLEEAQKGWNVFLNIGWLILMIINATFTVVRRSELNWKVLALPVFGSFIISTLFVVLFFGIVIVALPLDPDEIFSVQYFIVVGGMLLGNSLRGNIIGLSNFYSNLKKDENTYSYHLAAGATHFEAIRPYLRGGLNAAFTPTLASIATMGIITLPGMMTGQILGGELPIDAVKYQIAIMIAIFTSVVIGTCLALIFTVKTSFQPNGMLKPEIFLKSERKFQKVRAFFNRLQPTHTKKKNHK